MKHYVDRLVGVFGLLLLIAPHTGHALGVYDEGFALTWSNGSQNATVITEDPSGLSLNAYCGSKTAVVSHQAGGEFRPVSSGNKSMDGKNVLRFAVQNFTSSGTDPTSALSVQLYDANMNGRGWVSVLANIPGNKMKANTWYSVTIPLTALKVPADIRGIGFKASAKLVYAWDCMKIEYDSAYDTTPPPPPPPTVNPDHFVYIDALQSPWQYQAGSSVSMFNSSTVKYAGTNGLGIGFGYAYGTATLAHSGFNTAGYSMLSFFVYGPNGGGQQPTIALVNTSGTTLKIVPLTDYVSGNRLASGTWHSVSIPLADLLGTNRSIGGIRIQMPTATTGLYLDSIRFTANGTSTYTPPIAPPPPPAVGSATVFHDSIGSGWSNGSWGVSIDPDAGLHYEGGEGLEVKYLEALGGMNLYTYAFDTHGYNTLAFAIHPGESGDQEIYVYLNDEQGRELNHAYLGWYVVDVTLTPYKWHYVRIPLSDLGAQDRIITGITFKSDTATIVTVDELKFGSYTITNTGADNEY